MSDLIGTTLDYYRIDELIGQGTLGTVYKARHMREDRPVALKIIHEQFAVQTTFQQQFQRDIALLTTLRHSAILEIYEQAFIENKLYYASEYIKDGNLATFIERYHLRQQYPPLEDVLNYVIQIAYGLHFAHDQNILHLALTPSDILIKIPEGGDISNAQMIVSDLALQQLVSGGFNSEIAPLESTLSYLAPEICGGLPGEAEADIYSLGTILYELLIGHPPFQPLNPAQAIQLHMREPIIPPSDIRSGLSPELEEIVLKTLTKEPTSRYRAAAELARDLEKYLEQIRPGYSTQPNLMPLEDTAIIYETVQIETSHFTAPELDPGLEIKDRIIIAGKVQPTNVFPIEKDVIIIGRAESSDIVLDGDGVSRYHLRIERDTDGRYSITDAGSTNGTWLESYQLQANQTVRWSPGQALRLGAFRLVLEPAENLMLTQQIIVPPPIEEEIRQDTQFDTIEQVPLDISATLNPSRLSVVPGETASTTLTIINSSGRVDHFNVAIRNLPDGWLLIPETSIELLQDATDTVTITFNPPREPSSDAGNYSFEIVLTSRGQPHTFPVTVYGQLQVGSFYGFTVDLHPTRLNKRTRTSLDIQNTGNTAQQYRIEVTDPEESLDIRVNPDQVFLEPGKEATVAIQVRAQSRPFIGTTTQNAFEVTVTEERQGSTPQTQDGQLTIRPRLTTQTVSLLIAGFMLCGVISFIVIAGLISIRNNQIMEENLALTADFNKNATATLQADVDNDGLSLLEEQALGTDPNDFDTDNDGLSDSVEGRVGTDPANPDTDGDGVPDGTEININGTIPTNPDSDGDGLQDNVDPAPRELPTSTPLPPPTAAPPAG